MAEDNVKPERKNIKYAKFKTIMATAANDYNTIYNVMELLKLKRRKKQARKKEYGGERRRGKDKARLSNTFGKHAVSSVWAGVFASIRHITKRKRHEERKKNTLNRKKDGNCNG